MAKKLLWFCVTVVLALSFCATLSSFAQEKKDTDEVYTIKKGDTLWALSSRFLNNPFLWPKLWQRNPYITNPHWIYPGNPVRLTLATGAKAEEPKAQEAKKEEPKKVAAVEETPKKAEIPPEPKKPEIVPEKRPSQQKPLVFPEIRDAGVFGDIDYRGYGSVVESKEGKNLMSKGDICYIWFRFKDPVSVGDKYTTYNSNLAFTPVNIVGGRRFNVTGVIQIIERFGDFYTAKVLESFQEINKGDFIVPYNKERMEAGLETK
jgi:LysM domain